MTRKTVKTWCCVWINTAVMDELISVKCYFKIFVIQLSFKHKQLLRQSYIIAVLATSTIYKNSQFSFFQAKCIHPFKYCKLSLRFLAASRLYALCSSLVPLFDVTIIQWYLTACRILYYENRVCSTAQSLFVFHLIICDAAAVVWRRFHASWWTRNNVTPLDALTSLKFSFFH